MAAASLLGVSLIIHGAAFIGALLLLTLLAQITIISRLWVRIIAGTAGAVGSSWYLQGVAPFISYTEAAVAGDLGFGGYVYFGGFVALLTVWGYNLFKTQAVLIR